MTDSELWVGMPAARCIGGDAYSGHITAVLENGQELIWHSGEHDNMRDPMSGHEFTRRKNGRYYEKGVKFGRGTYLVLGRSFDKRDPSF